ncbi:MAG: MBL fold metallo-hydrolase [Deltaproteobacteria bacterium]|nr:MBL fold metallo-hydrolase [Deltaproteobacteria bacterium]
MRIRCWGSRGSIPVSGKDYIRYGGDTTCMEIRSKNDEIIIVDAGTGIRRLGNLLAEEDRYVFDLLFTHAHWDHLMGFPFFKPLYSERTHMRLQGCPFAQKFVETMLNKVMSPPNFPVSYGDIGAHVEYEPVCPEFMEIDSITVIPIPLSHPNQGTGFKFIEDGRSFVFLTDNELDFRHRGGLTFEEYRRFAEDADLLIHDAEYTSEDYLSTRQWGHSLFTSALELALSSGVKRFGLFHLNQERKDREVDWMVDRCRETVAKRGGDLECFAVGADMSFEL